MEKWKLPNDWGWKKLQEVVEINYGKGLAERQRQGGITPVYGANGVVGQHNVTLTKGTTIIIGRKGSAGAVNFSEVACWPIDTTYFIDQFPEFLEPRYLYHFLRSQPLSDLRQIAAIPGLNRDVLYSVEIPIPYPNEPTRSLETQRRIVIRLEALLAEVAEARELQEKIVEDTTTLPEAFLGEVFPEKTDWQMDPIRKFAEVKGGKRLPKGQPFADKQTKFPYLRVVDFKDFSIDASNLKYLTPEIQEQIKRYTISKDDIYISIAGTIGLVGTVPPELDGANLTENAAKIVIQPEYKDKINIWFLVYYLASSSGKVQIQKGTKAAGQPKLALMRIETIEVPTPDINIQQRIVIYIDSVREEVKEMNNAQKENAELITRLEQSFLAQAFRGEL